MKALLLILLALPSIALASDWEKEQKQKQDAANQFLSSLQNYQCFAEQGTSIAELPWEKSGIVTGPAHMLVRQSKDGLLFVQPVPTCYADYKCGFWLRSEKWSQGFFREKLVKVACPSMMNAKMVDGLIRTQYRDTLKLNY